MAVPSLSKLRELAGSAPYEAGALDTIRRLVATGDLPGERTCVLSREPTHDVLTLRTFVTSEHVRVQKAWSAVALSLLVGWHTLLMPSDSSKLIPAVGSEREVPTPLRLSARYHARMRRASQRRLKRLLKRVPLYAELLRQFPLARVEVDDPPEG